MFDNNPKVRRENLSLCFLIALAAAAPACFSPDTEAAQDSDLGATGGESDTSQNPETGGDLSASTGPGESVGDQSPASSSSTIDPGAETDPEMGTTGEVDPADETGGTETGEPGPTETGGFCAEQLGTPEHCLDCDDACGEGESCSPGGCAAPDAVGFSEPFAGIGGYQNRLWGFVVDVEQDAWLDSLNFHGVGNGGDIQLALYANAGGAPSDLLALTDVLESYTAGPYALDVDPIALEAGSYWLMARNNAPSQIGLDFDPNVPAYFELTSVFIDFDAPMPDTLEDTVTFPSYPINLWMTVFTP